MLKNLTLAGIICLSSAAFAGAGPLDGKSYCRTLVSDGMFGQPKGMKRQHCITFADGIATDNANTFFGNPPESALYNVNGRKVTFGKSAYNLSDDQSQLTTETGSTVAGVVLTLTSGR